MRKTGRSGAGRSQAVNRAALIVVGALVVVGAATVAFAVAGPSAKPAPAASASTTSKETAVEASSAVATAPPAATPATAALPATPPAPAPPKKSAKLSPAPRRATAPKPTAPRTLPETMHALLPGSTQLIVVTGAKLGSKSGTLSVFDKDGGRWHQVLTTAANFGATGLIDGAKRRQGHLNTPTGIWHIGSFVFGQHASAPSGTKMPYRHITSKSWWSSARNSTYNTWVNSSKAIDGEHLQDSKVQYEYAFDSGFNALPNARVIGRGTAIFIHCFEPAGNALGAYTHGCIAISRTAMLHVLALLDPSRQPTCAIGTLAARTPTSITSY